MKETFTLVKIIRAFALACLFVVLGTADAQVIYTTAKDGVGDFGRNTFYEIDLNKDGTIDFTVSIVHLEFMDVAAPGLYYHEYSARISASEGNEILVKEENLVPISSNTTIDNSLGWGFSISGYLSRYYFDGEGNPYEKFNSSGSGDFVNSTGKYVGVKFTADGKTYLGYIGIDTENLDQSSGSFTVIGYGYESTPGKAITAGAGETVAVMDSYVKDNTTITYLNNTIAAEFKNAFNGKIEVLNMSGQTVKSATVNGSSSSFSMEGLPSGIYQIVVSGAEGMFAEKIGITER